MRIVFLATEPLAPVYPAVVLKAMFGNFPSSFSHDEIKAKLSAIASIEIVFFVIFFIVFDF